jgi:transposase
MEKLLKAGHTAHKYARRLQIILNRAQGKSAREIALSYGVGRSTVSTIAKRYNEGGIAALMRDKTLKPGKTLIDEALKTKYTAVPCFLRMAGMSS